jgi:hypothetical protein
MENTNIAVREQAAHDWCTWEDAVIAHERLGTPGQYGAKPDMAKLAFVRICTHYFAHRAWLEDGQLLRDAHRLRGIPGILIHGRLDLSGPLLTAWELAQAWPDADLRIIETPVTPAALPWGPQSSTLSPGFTRHVLSSREPRSTERSWASLINAAKVGDRFDTLWSPLQDVVDRLSISQLGTALPTRRGFSDGSPDLIETAFVDDQPTKHKGHEPFLDRDLYAWSS